LGSPPWWSRWFFWDWRLGLRTGRQRGKQVIFSFFSLYTHWIYYKPLLCGCFFWENDEPRGRSVGCSCRGATPSGLDGYWVNWNIF
jgi:hypothetical protein